MTKKKLFRPSNDELCVVYDEKKTFFDLPMTNCGIWRKKTFLDLPMTNCMLYMTKKILFLISQWRIVEYDEKKPF